MEHDVGDRVDGYSIAGRQIGPEHPPYVIAEVSANHQGSLDDALELIRVAQRAGADAVKLQHYTPETITVRSDHPDFLVRGGTLWDGRQLFDLYAEAMTPWEWTDELAAQASKLGITWFSTPFDDTAVDFLAERDVPVFKIASFEIIDLPLIRRAAAQGRPLIISTGMATADEIDAAVTAARESGAPAIALLRCNSAYPAKPEDMDLVTIPAMRDRWHCPIGLSDHTLTHTAAIASVALGACVFEKHLTLDRSTGGPDGPFSLEPDEFTEFVLQVRTAHEALGRIRFGPTASEAASIAFRPSLRAIDHIRVGDVITRAVVDSVRPAGGLPPDAISQIVGRTVQRDLEPGEPITWDDLSPQTPS